MKLLNRIKSTILSPAILHLRFENSLEVQQKSIHVLHTNDTTK